MTWPLGVFIDEVKAKLISYGINAPWFEGAEFAAANYAPPRFVWYPVSADPDDAFKGHADVSASSLFTGKERFQVRCWGKDYEEAWTLRSQLLRAAANTAFADVHWRGDAWLHADPGSGAALQNGRIVVVALSLDVPVIDGDLTTAGITGISHACVLGLPTGDYDAD